MILELSPEPLALAIYYRASTEPICATSAPKPAWLLSEQSVTMSFTRTSWRWACTPQFSSIKQRSFLGANGASPFPFWWNPFPLWWNCFRLCASWMTPRSSSPVHTTALTSARIEGGYFTWSGAVLIIGQTVLGGRAAMGARASTSLLIYLLLIRFIR